MVSLGGDVDRVWMGGDCWCGRVCGRCVFLVISINVVAQLREG